MKSRVNQTISAFVEDLDGVPDQLLEHPAFRVKRLVKALYQVVSGLEIPVASVIALNLECANAWPGSATQRPEQDKVDRVQVEEKQLAAIQSYTQASVRSAFKPIVQAVRTA